MKSIWQSLVWKEWHELKWKLASILGILLGVTTASLLLSDGEKFAVAFGMMLMAVTVLSIFVGLGIAANERSRNTLPFLQALPVPMWRVAMTKHGLGAVTIMAPIILTVLSFFLWQLLFDAIGVEYRESRPGPVGTGSVHLDFAILCALIGVSFYAWAAACGVNRKDEISACAVALAVMVGWAAIIWTILWSLEPHIRAVFDDWLTTTGLSLAPGGIAIVIVERAQFAVPQVVFGIAIASLVHLSLLVFYVWRFGRVAERENISHRAAARSGDGMDWLAPPRRSALIAITWKQYRESGPIALAGLVGIIGVAGLVVGTQLFVVGEWRVVGLIGEIYTHVAIVFGFFIALVVGIGVCLSDASPPLNTFWRSRPIQADFWFWCKYATGLAVILATIYVPMVLLLGFDSTSNHRNIDAPMSIRLFGQVAVFSAAVAMTCLVRQAVYAAILSIATVYLATLVGMAAWFVAGLFGWVEIHRNRWLEPTDPQVIAGFITSIAISTLVAWLAVRFDWGLKGRF